MTESEWRRKLEIITTAINSLEEDFNKMAKKLNEYRARRTSLKWQLRSTSII